MAIPDHMFDRGNERDVLEAVLDASHAALRAVEASDLTMPQLPETVTLVAQTVMWIEAIARDYGIVLSEFRR